MTEKNYLNEFTVLSDNHWNNVHKTSEKIKKFYHSRQHRLDGKNRALIIKECI